MTNEKQTLVEEFKDLIMGKFTDEEMEDLSRQCRSLLHTFLREIAIEHRLDNDVAWVLLFGISILENHGMGIKIEKIEESKDRE